MKKIIINVFAILMVSLIVSCSAKQEELVIKSPEGKLTFSFKANKPSVLDPWAVKMTISGYEKERSLTLDMYNSDFNKETVLIDFIDENSCVITLMQSDDDNRVMDVFLSEKEIKLQERGDTNPIKFLNPLL